MLIRMEPYTPRTHQSFWCNQCDIVNVRSEDTSTGRFFVQSGHAFDYDNKEYDGDYHGVMFAVCKQCLTLV